MKIDYDRKIDRDVLNAEWKKDLVVLGKIGVDKLFSEYLGLDTGYKTMSVLEGLQMTQVVYHEDKKILFVLFNNVPGIETYSCVEIHNVYDETDAFYKYLNFITLLLIELQNTTPKQDIDYILKRNEENQQWLKQFVVVN